MAKEESEFPPELHGGLWHTTHPDRFHQILRAHAILPNPPIPDEERWKTHRGPHYYPFVRVLGGVSLFDFLEFEPVSYSSIYSMSSWREFVPFREVWGASVWIEINRTAVADRFVSGRQLVERWKAERAYRHTIMPGIEAAYIGPVPVSAFRQAYLSVRERPELQEMSVAL